MRDDESARDISAIAEQVRRDLAEQLGDDADEPASFADVLEANMAVLHHRRDEFGARFEALETALRSLKPTIHVTVPKQAPPTVTVVVPPSKPRIKEIEFDAAGRPVVIRETEANDSPRDNLQTAE